MADSTHEESSSGRSFARERRRGKPPNNPRLDGLDGLVGSQVNEIVNQPTDQPRPAAPFALSSCEIPPGALCINRRPGHVALRCHQTHLILFLTRLGVRNARDLLRRYSVVAVDAVAVDLDLELAMGLNPLEGMNNPGAVIHWRVRQRAEQLGLIHDAPEKKGARYGDG